MGTATSLRNLRISHYLIVIFLVLSFLINGIITFILYRAASRQVQADISRRLYDIVAVASQQIDGDLHRQLMALSRQKTPAAAQNSRIYLELKQDLQKIRDAASDIHFIYTMRTAGAFKTAASAADNAAAGTAGIMFMVDAESDPGQMAGLGDIYTDASPLLSRSFAGMREPVVEASFYQDHWGTWLSGYAPFYDSKGMRAGVLGVDISAATVAQYQKDILLKSLMIFLVTLPFVVAAALLLGRWFGSPLMMMQKGAQAMTSGDLDHRLEIPLSRELSVLATTLNQMAHSLRQEQDNLRQMAAKYRNIFENATDGIFQTTPDGRLLTANTAMVDMLGYDNLDEMEAAIGRRIVNIYENPEDRQTLIRRLTQQNRISGFEVRLKQKDGSGMMAELNVHLCDYGGENGEGKIIEGSIRDITQRIEREKAERDKEAALAASQAKSEFLANMSHEIRTPLNAVMGLTDLLTRTQLSDTQQQYLRKISISSRSLLAVINDILDFSKIEAGRLELEHTPFSLYDLMANIAEMFAFTADEKGLEFLLSVDEHAPTAVIGDSVRLGQVLINLVGNAMKFTETGEILVTVSMPRETGEADGCSTESRGTSQKVTFSVRDTGIGIPEDRLEALFDSFTQADGSTTRKYGGTGLGLTISRRLVRLMGGDISVTSAPGKGSCFSFTIPLERQADKNQIVLHPPRDLRGLRVLIVDDNRTALTLLASIIQSFQMEAVVATSGEEALDILTGQSDAAPFDLVLMDWKMPQMNGLEAARRIKLEMALDKTPIVCMVSAHAREDLIQQADRKFLDAFLHKPVNQSFLFDTIMELFGRHDARVASDMPAPSSGRVVHEKLMGKQILLVEDNEINREVAVEWLTSAGLEVDVAVNGREALRFLGVLPDGVPTAVPDAVLMDIQMPEMDGFEATGHIRRDPRYPDLPVIAMTAHALKGDREKCLDAGMNDYVTKPIDPDILFQTLAKWILSGEIQGHEPAIAGAARFPGPAEDHPAGSSPDFEITGLNVATGLYRSNNNQDLFRKLMKSFIRDFGDARQILTANLSGGSESAASVENARMLVHSVKGVSANLGAETLSAAAADLEKALIPLAEAPLTDEPGTITIPEKIRQAFDSALEEVVTGISAYLDGTRAAGAGQVRFDDGDETAGASAGGSGGTGSVRNAAALSETLDRLDAMLDDDLNAARDLLESVASDLRAVVGGSRFQQLTDAMDDFEIDDASDMITEMTQLIKQAAGPGDS